MKKPTKRKCLDDKTITNHIRLFLDKTSLQNNFLMMNALDIIGKSVLKMDKLVAIEFLKILIETHESEIYELEKEIK